jgi:predicted acyl esterase
MRSPSWASRPVLIIAAVAVLAAAIVVLAVSTGGGGTLRPTRPAGVGSDVATRIPAAGGITLSAEVITPAGPGPFPLVVMPASWGSGASEYTVAGQGFAAAGYLVVAYAQRGFKGSGGAIDFAAPQTRADVSTVIDWALAHTSADRNHVGMLGISYGGGISLLAAASDKRIKAVVAMSGWGDLAAALAPNDTPNLLCLHLLLDGQLRSGTVSTAVRQLGQSLSGDSAGTAAILASMTGTRSADAEIAALNANNPAIMLANAYEDSIVDPAQIVPFFERLTTPKRLQLAPGDHGGPEGPGLQGKPDQTFTDARHWLDHYLRGRSNGIDRADPIQLVDGATKAVHGYRDWPAATAFQLGTPNTPDDVLAAGAAPWSRQLTTGTDSGAGSGPPFTLQPNPFHPPTVKIASVNADQALLWSGAATTQPVVISGSPTVHLDVAAATPATTFYAYLYDVDASGSGRLMTYAPDTISSGATTLTLHPTSWTVAAGHHIVLAIDTVDARYVSAAPSGSALTFSSTAAAPATLTVPFGH